MSNKSIPNANVSLNKNRLKHYNRVDVGHNSFENAVFLSDGDEFEIELDNPSQDTYLAKVELNGKRISTSGVVLRPGQHVFLERYLEEKKRFRFDTYNVPKQNSDAIEKNGLVEVKFFKEQETPSYGDTIIKTNWDFYDSPITYEFDSGTEWHTVKSSSSDYRATSFTASTSSNLSTSGAESKSDEIETGRVEKGGKSSQDFVQVQGNFEAFERRNSKIKILPKSSKPATKQDIRVYCPNCGKKLKDSWNFCTKCGTERP